MRTSKIQNDRQGAPKWLMVSGKIFGRSRQLSLNKFFDPSSSSMKKVNNGEKKKKKDMRKEKIMSLIVATNVVAN